MVSPDAAMFTELCAWQCLCYFYCCCYWYPKMERIVWCCLQNLSLNRIFERCPYIGQSIEWITANPPTDPYLKPAVLPDVSVLVGNKQIARDNGVTAYRMMRRIIGEPDMTITTPGPPTTSTQPSSSAARIAATSTSLTVLTAVATPVAALTLAMCVTLVSSWLDRMD